ncbi:MAG: peptidoglycan DD-metalloendopeptidase family protein [Microthrixaceae bacterium]
MPRRTFLCALVLCVFALHAPAASAETPRAPTYLPPVDAPVVDPFRPPPGPYGAGNRGLEYGTAPETVVRAAAAGVVSFAGAVAGSRHVTIRHPDGLRTTYSFLSAIHVVVGQRVAQGDGVGATVGRLHFSARAGDAYFDPASLFTSGVRVRLVPFDEPPGAGPGGERGAIRQLIGGIGGVAGAAVSSVGAAIEGGRATADWLRDAAGQPLRTVVHYLEVLGPGGVPFALVRAGVDAWFQARAAADRPCTADSQDPPARPGAGHVALLVGGLGSSSSHAAIDELDTDRLGYDPAEVLRFSYLGGRTPDGTDRFTGVRASSYGAADTQGDLRAAARRLADLLEEVSAVAPDRPIDVVAHSQGGLVARLALIELERRHGEAWLARLGVLITLGTPHAGADLATAAYAIGATPAGSALLDIGADAVGVALDDHTPALRQLAETSEIIEELRSTPVHPSLQAVSVAARSDLVVPVPRTAAPGMQSAVVPVDGVRAHDALPGAASAAREVALATAGLPPTCTSLGAALRDHLVGAGIAWAEDTAGALGWLLAAGASPSVGG